MTAPKKHVAGELATGTNQLAPDSTLKPTDLALIRFLNKMQSTADGLPNLALHEIKANSVLTNELSFDEPDSGAPEQHIRVINYPNGSHRTFVVGGEGDVVRFVDTDGKLHTRRLRSLDKRKRATDRLERRGVKAGQQRSYRQKQQIRNRESGWFRRFMARRRLSRT